jgi:hypothetical protein
MCRVYGSDSVDAVVPVYNTNTLDTAAAKYWQLAGEFEGEWHVCSFRACVMHLAEANGTTHSALGISGCQGSLRG